jgi:hypothetical protein
MPKYLLTNAKITVASVDLSNFGFQLDTPDDREQVDVTGFNSTATREYLPGTRTQQIVVSFLQGFGSNEPHQVLQPLYEGGSIFVISIQVNKSLPASISNPTFGGSTSLYSYNGLTGAYSARGEVVATFLPATPAGFAWGTV